MLVNIMNTDSLEKIIIHYQWEPAKIYSLIAIPAERKEIQLLMVLKVCDKYLKKDMRSHKLALFAANTLTKEFPSVGNIFFAALAHEKTEQYKESVLLYQNCEDRIAESALRFAITAMRFRALYKQTNNKECLKESIYNFQNAIIAETSEMATVWEKAKRELERVLEQTK